jgi:hypothetical protein
MMTIPIHAVSVASVVRRPVLSGRLHGAADKAKLQAAVSAAKSGVVLLDLGGAEFLSSSYFDEAIWPLWASIGDDIYPVLGNVPTAAADDIEIVLKEQGAAVWSVTAKKKIAFDEARMVGKLDEALRLIVERVQATGDITAADLAGDRSTESIGATAWSNRLALLHKFRLLQRRKDGRRLIYALPWKE